MRKLSILLMAGLLAVGLAAPSSSATLNLTGSTLGVSLGALPSITIAQSPASVPIAVSSGTGGFVLPAGVFSSFVILNKNLFTGVSLISSLNVSAANGTLTQAGGAGVGVVTGNAVIGVLGGLINLVIPLNAGAAGTTSPAAAALAITVEFNAGWTTGTVAVSWLTSTTPNGATTTVPFTTVQTAMGSDSRTAGHAGMITLVNPSRVLTNAAGNLALFAIYSLNFAGTPEPGTLLLIGSGVVGLAVLGRRRMRK